MPTRTRRPGTGPAANGEATMTDVANPTATATENPTNEATPAAEVPAGENGAAPAATGDEAKSKKNTAPIQITVPLDLKAQIDAQAEKDGKTSARWILENIAGDLTYTLPEATRVATNRGGVKMADVFGKDLTPAQKKDRLSAAKTLLDALAKGVVNLDDIKAKLGQPAAAATPS